MTPETASPTPPELLDLARSLGVTVEAHGDRLRVRGPRSQEPLIRSLLAHKAAVLALVGDRGLAGVRPAPTPTVGSAPRPPESGGTVDPEAAVLLAEVLALLPRVNRHWKSYIRTRLEVDAGNAERLRVVRDWTLAHAELAPENGSATA